MWAAKFGIEIFQARGGCSLSICSEGWSKKMRSLQPRNDKPEFVDLGYSR